MVTAKHDNVMRRHFHHEFCSLSFVSCGSRSSDFVANGVKWRKDRENGLFPDKYIFPGLEIRDSQ